MKEYSGISTIQQYAIGAHATRVIELVDDTEPPIYEAGFELEGREGAPEGYSSSAIVVDMVNNAGFQAAITSNYCGVPSKLENRGFEIDRSCPDFKSELEAKIEEQFI